MVCAVAASFGSGPCPLRRTLPSELTHLPLRTFTPCFAWTPRHLGAGVVIVPWPALAAYLERQREAMDKDYFFSAGGVGLLPSRVFMH